MGILKKRGTTHERGNQALSFFSLSSMFFNCVSKPAFAPSSISISSSTVMNRIPCPPNPICDPHIKLSPPYDILLLNCNNKKIAIY